MLRLHTFGGISIVDDSGRPITRALALRRPLALVAIVAAGNEHGVTRDKLLGLLWPDVDADRARHSLTQALYAARRALNVDDLFLTDGSIRLNAERIWSDVVAFDAAIATGAFADAAKLYSGPFLDGFRVMGAPGIEEWITAQQVRLEDRAIAALDTLAAEAECSGGMATALHYRKRIAAVRRFDTNAISQYVALLARSGHQAEALRQAEAHAQLLAREFDLKPDKSFVALIEQLRTPSRGSDDTRERPTSTSEPQRPNESPPNLRQNRWRAAAPTPRRKGRIAAVIGLVLAAATTVIGGLWARVGDTSHSLPGQRLVVTPFDLTGANPSLGYLGAAMVELLTPRLALDSAVRPIDVGAVFAALRTRHLDRGVSIPQESAIDLAVSVGAERVVVGSVIGTRGHAVIQATVLLLPSKRELAKATVDGPADSIVTLVGQLAARLLVSEAGENERIAIHSSGSLQALRFLLAGREADRRRDYARAAREYARALSTDSSLAIAALRLAIVADQTGNSELEADATAWAWRHREELDAREQSLLLAFAGPQYPQPSPAAEQLRVWSDLVSRERRSADGWSQFAARLFHEGDRLGSASVHEQTLTAVRRALAIDTADVAAGRLLAAIEARAGGFIMLDAAEPDVSALTAARATAMAALWTGQRRDEGREAINRLAEAAVNSSEAVDAVLAEYALTSIEGRTADAFASTKRLHALRPDSHAYLRLRVLDGLYGNGDPAIAAAAAAELVRTFKLPVDGFPLEARRRVADGCIVAQWKLAHGDTSGVNRVIELLRSRTVRRDLPPVSASPQACAELLDAALAVSVKRSDALARVQHLDSLALTAAVAGNAASYSHILIARLFSQLGHPRRALSAIRKRSYMLGWPTYLVTTWQEERRLAEAVGDDRLAADARRALIALRGAWGA